MMYPGWKDATRSESFAGVRRLDPVADLTRKVPLVRADHEGGGRERELDRQTGAEAGWFVLELMSDPADRSAIRDAGHTGPLSAEPGIGGRGERRQIGRVEEHPNGQRCPARGLYDLLSAVATRTKNVVVGSRGDQRCLVVRRDRCLIPLRDDLGGADVGRELDGAEPPPSPPTTRHRTRSDHRSSGASSRSIDTVVS